jgi:hypothetical protein
VLLLLLLLLLLRFSALSRADARQRNDRERRIYYGPYSVAPEAQHTANSTSNCLYAPVDQHLSVRDGLFHARPHQP